MFTWPADVIELIISIMELNQIVHKYFIPNVFKRFVFFVVSAVESSEDMAPTDQRSRTQSWKAWSQY